MAKRTVTFSFEEEVIKMLEEIVKAKLEIENKSHLLSTLIIKEYSKIKKVNG